MADRDRSFASQVSASSRAQRDLVGIAYLVHILGVPFPCAMYLSPIENNISWPVVEFILLTRERLNNVEAFRCATISILECESLPELDPFDILCRICPADENTSSVISQFHTLAHICK